MKKYLALPMLALALQACQNSNDSHVSAVEIQSKLFFEPLAHVAPYLSISLNPSNNDGTEDLYPAFDLSSFTAETERAYVLQEDYSQSMIQVHSSLVHQALRDQFNKAIASDTVASSLEILENFRIAQRRDVADYIVRLRNLDIRQSGENFYCASRLTLEVVDLDGTLAALAVAKIDENGLPGISANAMVWKPGCLKSDASGSYPGHFTSDGMAIQLDWTITQRSLAAHIVKAVGEFQTVGN